jgi:hypothetical protein
MLPKEALYLLYPEQPTTYQQAVAEILRKSGLLVLDVHKQAKGKAWETTLVNKIPSGLPKSVFAANFRPITSHDYLQ